jgi:hypothetical protein
MEDLLTQEYRFTKPKIRIQMRYVFILGALYFGWNISDYFLSDGEKKNWGVLVFYVGYLTLFILSIVDTFNKYSLVIEDGYFKVNTNFYTKFSFQLSEVEYIDRHFDEWTFVLKNAKKHKFSDQVIRKEEKALFKELMNSLPKKYPELQL